MVIGRGLFLGLLQECGNAVAFSDAFAAAAPAVTVVATVVVAFVALAVAVVVLVAAAANAAANAAADAAADAAVSVAVVQPWTALLHFPTYPVLTNTPDSWRLCPDLGTSRSALR